MGWNHGNVLLDFINTRNIVKMVEIGVYKSNLCKAILRRLSKDTSLLEYWTVDNWGYILNDKYRDKGRYSEERWHAYYLHNCRLMRFFPCLHTVRATSLDAATIFPDEYFDLVYIDADHGYHAVVQDIKVWLPKVKKGGIISGHDYKGHHASEVVPAVRAVLGKEVDSDMAAGVWYKEV